MVDFRVVAAAFPTPFYEYVFSLTAADLFGYRTYIHITYIQHIFIKIYPYIFVTVLLAGASSGIASGVGGDGVGEKSDDCAGNALLGRKRARLMPARGFEKITPEAGEGEGLSIIASFSKF